MQHQIVRDQLGPRADPMAHAVEACVHCGFCLPACPTYVVLGEEMDSPRGRIILMKDVLEGALDPETAGPYLDRCLGCLGCVTACPSGVEYGALIASYRAESEPRRRRSLADRFVRRWVLGTLPYPRRFRVMAVLGRWVRPLRRLFPGRLRAMLQLLPPRLPRSQPLPAAYPAEGPRRARVALLAGCAQQVLAPEINWATLRVLARNGVEVVVPEGQGCCGALAAHCGAGRLARNLARRNIHAFPTDVDAVVTNAAGCGSGLREYPLWLKGEPEEEAARQLAAKATDVTALLDQLGPRPPGPLEEPLRAAYHDACHLAHAQKVSSPPRNLLTSIPNLDLVEIPNGEICCGSAGTYNLEHPEIADRLGAKKAAAIAATGAQAVIAGNIGCIVQIQAHLRRQGIDWPVYHTVQVLDQAYQRRNR